MKKDKEAGEHPKEAPEKAGHGKAHHAKAGPPAPSPEAAELEQLKDQMLRLRADFENYRKRNLRERDELCLRANSDLLLEILPVLDHFELGLRSAAEHQAGGAVVAGFQLVYDQLLAALARFGLAPFDATGQTFDPQVHEAVSHLPSAEHPADAVITQTRRGYRLGEMLLRPAQVVVSSGPGAPSGGASPAAAEPAPEDQSAWE